MRVERPHIFAYGEVIHGDYVEIMSVSGMGSVTEYEPQKTTWSVLKEENSFGLDWALKRHNTFAESFVPVTSVGSYDISRIATQAGVDKVVLAATVLFTVAGVPLVYYGNEQGYTGPKEERIGGDNQIHPVFPDYPKELPTLDADLYRAYQQLVAVRRHFPWLHSACVETDELRNGFLRYRMITTDAVLVDNATGTSGEIGASDGMSSLIVELNLENGATSTMIRDNDHVGSEFFQALIATLGCLGEPRLPEHHVRAVILSCPIDEWAQGIMAALMFAG